MSSKNKVILVCTHCSSTSLTQLVMITWTLLWWDELSTCMYVWKKRGKCVIQSLLLRRLRHLKAVSVTASQPTSCGGSFSLGWKSYNAFMIWAFKSALRWFVWAVKSWCRIWKQLDVIMMSFRVSNRSRHSMVDLSLLVGKWCTMYLSSCRVWSLVVFGSLDFFSFSWLFFSSFSSISWSFCSWLLCFPLCIIRFKQ